MKHAENILDAHFEEHPRATSGIAPSPKASRLRTFVNVAPLLLEDIQDLISEIDEAPADRAGGIAVHLRTLVRMAQEADSPVVAGISRGLHAYAALLHSGALCFQQSDWSFLVATTRALESALDKIKSNEVNDGCAAEARAAEAALLQHYPFIAGLVARYSSN